MFQRQPCAPEFMMDTNANGIHGIHGKVHLTGGSDHE